jgi:hypothetical protein
MVVVLLEQFPALKVSIWGFDRYIRATTSHAKQAKTPPDDWLSLAQVDLIIGGLLWSCPQR